MESMRNAVYQAALKLNKTDRILLVQDIWDSIATEPSNVKLSTAQRAELKRRIVRLKKTGPLGSPWRE